MIVAPVSLALSGCGWFGNDERAALELAWLNRDVEIRQVIEQIRTQGLEAVASSAHAGSVAACVADRLDKDPLGKLATVEGALAESVPVNELLADLESLLSQELNFESASSLLQKGADIAAYAKVLIEEQGIAGASKSLAAMSTQAESYAQQDLGGHFQTLIEGCKTRTN
ncbi:hypothetical protein [Shewanella sp.]|uniref:hypothetical protein n=1 Tax=Shewanella sp. TaxID=50422 RepID=UPI0035699E36